MTAMNDSFFAEHSVWLRQAGLAGTAETDIVNGFCDRCVAAGLPIARAHVFIDTLHPVHEGRLFRGDHRHELALMEYGRTSAEGLSASGSDTEHIAAAQRWQQSPFYRMLQPAIRCCGAGWCLKHWRNSPSCRRCMPRG